MSKGKEAVRWTGMGILMGAALVMGTIGLHHSNFHLFMEVLFSLSFLVVILFWLLRERQKG